MNLAPYFILAVRPGIRSVGTAAWGSVTFSRITLAFARQLWLGGFEYLYLTPEGAQHLFADTTVEDRRKLLELCRTPEEVYAIRDIKRGKAIDKAAEQRLAELAAEYPPAAQRVVDTPEPEGSV